MPFVNRKNITCNWKKYLSYNVTYHGVGDVEREAHEDVLEFDTRNGTRSRAEGAERGGGDDVALPHP